MPAKKRRHSLTGFTLIEMLVSVAIFATVMVMALGALLAMSESNRRVETMKSVINTLNFALDAMSRSIRTGVEYNCGAGGNCEGETSLSFISAEGDLVEYRLGTASCANGVGCIERRVTPEVGSPSDWLSLTSREVVVETLLFYVNGAPLGDAIQPKATILLAGYVDVSASQRSRFELQTSVTQRVYDL